MDDFIKQYFSRGLELIGIAFLIVGHELYKDGSLLLFLLISFFGIAIYVILPIFPSFVQYFKEPKKE